MRTAALLHRRTGISAVVYVLHAAINLMQLQTLIGTKLFRCLTVFMFPITEPAFLDVERSRSEQSESVLQGESLFGPVGAHHQPPRTMNFQLQEEAPVKGLSSAQDWMVWTLMDTLPSRNQIPKRC